MKSLEVKIGTSSDFDKSWDFYPILSLIRDNEDKTGKEVDIDVTFDIASSYFFVK